MFHVKLKKKTKYLYLTKIQQKIKVVNTNNKPALTTSRVQSYKKNLDFVCYFYYNLIVSNLENIKITEIN